MAPRVGTSFWKVAGLSYLQFLNVSTRAISKVLKVYGNSFQPKVMKYLTALNFVGTRKKQSFSKTKSLI